MTPEEERWQHASDEEVEEAVRQLHEFTEVGRDAILVEAGRRGLQTEPAGGGEPELQISEAELQHALEQLRSKQNLLAGVSVGLVTAAIGAIAWAGITVATGYQIGFMAIGVGYMVGYAVRVAGKGIDTTYGVAGAILAALGCAAGNLLAVCGLVAGQEELAILDVLARLDLDLATDLMVATFSPMDLLFYGIAIYERYRFSLRRVTQEELGQLLGRS